MSWDATKHDPMLLEYLAACTFFGVIGYNPEAIRPILCGTDFGIQVLWQGRSAEIRVGSIGDMPVDQLQEKFLAMINDWNQHASQTDREQVWQASEMKRRAEDILLPLALRGFPISKSD